jgi:hypothetical protein
MEQCLLESNPAPWNREIMMVRWIHSCKTCQHTLTNSSNNLSNLNVVELSQAWRNEWLMTSSAPFATHQGNPKHTYINSVLQTILMQVKERKAASRQYSDMYTYHTRCIGRNSHSELFWRHSNSQFTATRSGDVSCNMVTSFPIAHWRLKFIYTTLQDSHSTLQKPCAYITKTTWLMMLRETTAVHSETYHKCNQQVKFTFIKLIQYHSRMVRYIYRWNYWGLVCCDVTDQLPIRFSAFLRYWRKNWSTMRQYSSQSQPSKKPTIQLGWKYWTVFPQSLGHPWN